MTKITQDSPKNQVQNMFPFTATVKKMGKRCKSLSLSLPPSLLLTKHFRKPSKKFLHELLPGVGLHRYPGRGPSLRFPPSAAKAMAHGITVGGGREKILESFVVCVCVVCCCVCFSFFAHGYASLLWVSLFWGQGAWLGFSFVC